MNPRLRRFNLGDLMILIAAIGIATMTLRSLWQGLTVGPGEGYWSVTPSRLLVAAILSACATPLTLACLAFRIRRPRPPWRRVAIQPGTAALVACSVIFAFQVAEVAISLALPNVYPFGGTKVSPIRFGFGESVSLVVMRSTSGNELIGHIEPLACFGALTTNFATPCGPAVAAVWLVLALSGRWRPERSWIDRLGRFLGVTWIVISILAAFPMT
jgi:hypothetical protein